jgi:hypothetical protein
MRNRREPKWFTQWLAQRDIEEEDAYYDGLGDGVDQAAEIASRTISIPSLNFAPLMIFGNWF